MAPEGLSSERLGFVCRDLVVESIPALQGADARIRDRIAAVPEELAGAKAIRGRGG